jgi:hypothetical protein
MSDTDTPSRPPPLLLPHPPLLHVPPCVATLRIRFLPSAAVNIVQWEGLQAQQLEPPTVSTDEAASTSLDHLLGCMTLDDAAPSAVPESRPESGAPRSHATWCAVHRPAAGVASPAVPSCTCKDSVPLPCQLVVNAAWERLFGWSQEEVRRKVMRYGLRAQSEWYRLDSWFAYHLLLGQSHKDAKGGTNFRTFTIVRPRGAKELSCLLHKKGVHKDGFVEGTLRYYPLQGSA